MKTKKKKFGLTKTNFLIDLIIFVAFLAAMDPRMTGIAIHEWLSIAFGTAVVVHLLLHWDWIVALTKRFFKKVAAQSRLNYVLNWLFFVDMTILIFTGIMISEVALPLLGIRLEPGFMWRRLHSLTADWALIILGLHVALHWRWIVNTTKRYVVAPLLPNRRKPATEVQA